MNVKLLGWELILTAWTLVKIKLYQQFGIRTTPHCAGESDSFGATATGTTLVLSLHLRWLCCPCRDGISAVEVGLPGCIGDWGEHEP